MGNLLSCGPLLYKQARTLEDAQERWNTARYNPNESNVSKREEAVMPTLTTGQFTNKPQIEDKHPVVKQIDNIKSMEEPKVVKRDKNTTLIRDHHLSLLVEKTQKKKRRKQKTRSIHLESVEERISLCSLDIIDRGCSSAPATPPSTIKKSQPPPKPLKYHAALIDSSILAQPSAQYTNSTTTDSIITSNSHSSPNLKNPPSMPALQPPKKAALPACLKTPAACRSLSESESKLRNNHPVNIVNSVSDNMITTVLNKSDKELDEHRSFLSKSDGDFHKLNLSDSESDCAFSNQRLSDSVISKKILLVSESDSVISKKQLSVSESDSVISKQQLSVSESDCAFIKRQQSSESDSVIISKQQQSGSESDCAISKRQQSSESDSIIIIKQQQSGSESDSVFSRQRPSGSESDSVFSKQQRSNSKPDSLFSKKRQSDSVFSKQSQPSSEYDNIFIKKHPHSESDSQMHKGPPSITITTSESDNVFVKHRPPSSDSNIAINRPRQLDSKSKNTLLRQHPHSESDTQMHKGPLSVTIITSESDNALHLQHKNQLSVNSLNNNSVEVQKKSTISLTSSGDGDDASFEPSPKELLKVLRFGSAISQMESSLTSALIHSHEDGSIKKVSTLLEVPLTSRPDSIRKVLTYCLTQTLPMTDSFVRQCEENGCISSSAAEAIQQLRGRGDGQALGVKTDRAETFLCHFPWSENSLRKLGFCLDTNNRFYNNLKKVILLLNEFITLLSAKHLFKSTKKKSSSDFIKNKLFGNDDLLKAVCSIDVIYVKQCKNKLPECLSSRELPLYSVGNWLLNSYKPYLSINLSNSTVNEWFFKQLQGKSLESLAELSLNNCLLEANTLLSILLTQKSSNLQILNIGNISIADEVISRIGLHPGNQMSHLHTLNLSGSSLTEFGLAVLVNSLSTSLTAIQRLDISFNNLSRTDSNLFSDLITKSSSIKSLRMRSCNLSSESLRTVSTGLQNSQVEVLELSDNQFNCLHFAQLAFALQSRTTLRQLGIANTRLLPDGMERFELSQSFELGLQTLDLSRNQLGEAGAVVLASILARQNQLQTLNINTCRINKKGLERILTSLENTDTNIRTLYLRDNPLDQGPMSQSNSQDFKNVEQRVSTLSTNKQINVYMLDIAL